MADRLFSTYQVAELLGATPGMVVEWVQKGLLPHSKHADGPLRIPEEGLVQFVKERGGDLPGILSRLAAQEPSRSPQAPARPAAPAQPARPSPPSLPQPKQPPPGEGDDLARSLLTQAIDAGADAIHLDPVPNGLLLRLNVDGLLRPAGGLDQPLSDPQAADLAERLRRLARLEDLPERQDPPAQGLFVFPAAGRSVTIRLVDQPTPQGRRLVLHLADPARTASLDALNLPQSQRETLQDVLAQPHGLVLIVAGDRATRTVLLHTLLGRLADQRRRTAALERPSDLPLHAARSIVNPLVGQSIGQWAWMLPRLDADALLVSDLADPRTAHAALEAADKAIVLAGIDANSPADALQRLLDMGLEPWPLSLSLRLIAHAATVRLLCPACKSPDDQAADRVARLNGQDQPRPAFAPAGCPACGQSGYAGRAVLLGLTRIEGDLARALRNGGGEALAIALEAGGTGLLQAGLAKARAGLTSLAEIERVLGPPR